MLDEPGIEIGFFVSSSIALLHKPTLKYTGMVLIEGSVTNIISM